MYSEPQMTEIRAAADETNRALRELIARLVGQIASVLQSARAVEYLQHGVCRRLETLRTCLRRVFAIFPVDRTHLLDEEERALVEISLQAYIINVYGVLDNVAWVLLFEQGVELKRGKVGLFYGETQKHLPQKLVDHIREPTLQEWYTEYAKNYRDSLAHRIPLYVPPKNLVGVEPQYKELGAQIQAVIVGGRPKEALALTDEQAQLGRALPAYVHSFWDSDKSPPMVIHLQMIADARTIIEILDVAFPATPS